MATQCSPTTTDWSDSCQVTLGHTHYQTISNQSKQLSVTKNLCWAAAWLKFHSARPLYLRQSLTVGDTRLFMLSGNKVTNTQKPENTGRFNSVYWVETHCMTLGILHLCKYLPPDMRRVCMERTTASNNGATPVRISDNRHTLVKKPANRKNIYKDRL